MINIFYHENHTIDHHLQKSIIGYRVNFFFQIFKYKIIQMKKLKCNIIYVNILKKDTLSHFWNTTNLEDVIKLL